MQSCDRLSLNDDKRRVALSGPALPKKCEAPRCGCGAASIVSADGGSHPGVDGLLSAFALGFVVTADAPRVPGLTSHPSGGSGGGGMGRSAASDAVSDHGGGAVPTQSSTSDRAGRMTGGGSALACATLACNDGAGSGATRAAAEGVLQLVAAAGSGATSAAAEGVLQLVAAGVGGSGSGSSVWQLSLFLGM